VGLFDIDTSFAESIIELLGAERLAVENVRSYSFNDSMIVELSGEHDMSTMPSIEPAMAAACRDANLVVVDLSRATFIDSSVLSMLLRAHKRIGERLRVVVATGSRVHRIFEITQMDRYLVLSESMDRALRGRVA
jgi:anti-sigma B factor antagonist